MSDTATKETLDTAYKRARAAAEGVTALSDLVEHFVKERFACLEGVQRTKARYAYVSGRIEQRQELGRDVPDRLWRLHDGLAERLQKQDIRPSEVAFQDE